MSSPSGSFGGEWEFWVVRTGLSFASVCFKLLSVPIVALGDIPYFGSFSLFMSSFPIVEIVVLGTVPCLGVEFPALDF